MISKQETLYFSPYVALYDLLISKDNMLRQINKLVKKIQTTCAK